MSFLREYYRFSIPLLFLIPFFQLYLNGPRFVDEDQTIVDGDLFISSFFDPQVSERAAFFNSYSGVGLGVSIPSGFLMRLTGDIAAPRSFMALYAALYWISLLIFFFSFIGLLDGRIKQSGSQAFLLGFIFVCFVQGIPGSYISQAYCLSEYPGAAFLLLGFAAFIQKKFALAAVLGGIAATFKINFFLHSPLFVAGAACLSFFKEKRLKGAALDLVQYSLLYFSVPILLQAFKVTSYGWHNYWAAWKPYLDWFVNTSGAGLGNKELMLINEYINYSWQMKAYYLLGTFSPFCSFFVWYVAKRSLPTTVKVFLFVVGVTVLAGSYQWFFVAEYKWWRRAFAFMIPGYAIGIATMLGLVYVGIQSQRTRRIVLSILLLVSLYVQVYQTFFGTYRTTVPLTPAERLTFDWNGPWPAPVPERRER